MKGKVLNSLIGHYKLAPEEFLNQDEIETIHPDIHYDIVELTPQDVSNYDGVLMFLREHGLNITDEDTFESKVQNGTCTKLLAAVLKDGDSKRIIGYINNEIIPRDDDRDHYIFGHATLIDNLVVLQDYRRYGVATNLMRAMLTSTQNNSTGYGFLQLYVRNANVAAIYLYRKARFKLFSSFKNRNYENKNYAIMLYQQNQTLDVLGSILMASIKQLGHSASEAQINTWFDNVKKTKGQKINEQFVDADQLYTILSDRLNDDLFKVTNSLALDYYQQKYNIIHTAKSAALVGAENYTDIELPRYPFEQYVKNRVDYYYQHYGTTYNTINDVNRKNNLHNPQYNYGPEIIQILKCAMVTARDSGIINGDVDLLYHACTSKDLKFDRFDIGHSLYKDKV